MYEFKIPEDVPEALHEIQKLLRTAMHDVDGLKLKNTGHDDVHAAQRMHLVVSSKISRSTIDWMRSLPGSGFG